MGVQKILGLFYKYPLYKRKKIGVWCAISAHHVISIISRQALQRGNNMLCQYTDCIQSGGQHFSASSVALFLLGFLKVVITTNLLLASFADRSS
jgi:hypothetical protein